jgi:hypothetical protein
MEKKLIAVVLRHPSATHNMTPRNSWHRDKTTAYILFSHALFSGIIGISLIAPWLRSCEQGPARVTSVVIGSIFLGIMAAFLIGLLWRARRGPFVEHDLDSVVVIDAIQQVRDSRIGYIAKQRDPVRRRLRIKIKRSAPELVIAMKRVETAHDEVILIHRGRQRQGAAPRSPIPHSRNQL